MVFDLAAWAVILLAAGLVGRGALALLRAGGLRRGDVFLLSAWIGVVLVASFNIEAFSLGRLMQISRKHLDERLAKYRAMLAIE